MYFKQIKFFKETLPEMLTGQPVRLKIYVCYKSAATKYLDMKLWGQIKIVAQCIYSFCLQHADSAVCVYLWDFF